jgi:hypothetical protein
MAKPFGSKRSVESTEFRTLEELVLTAIQFTLENAERNLDPEYLADITTIFCDEQDTIRKVRDDWWYGEKAHGKIIGYKFHPSDTCLNEACICRP